MIRHSKAPAHPSESAHVLQQSRVSRVTVVLGTRPEAIKLAPVVRALSTRTSVRLVLTGQHGPVVDDLLHDLALQPDVNLRSLRRGGDLNDLASRLLTGISGDLGAHPPDIVIVQGDTTSALCAAISAFHKAIPVAHVEAGLRTNDRRSPFPEELNRRLISQLATWHFAPTLGSAANLCTEGHPASAIEVTGNTVIDNLLWVRDRSLGTSRFIGPAGRRLLVTLHRRETQGEQMKNLCLALGEAARELDLEVVLPLHPSPSVRASVEPQLANHPNVTLCEPLSYVDFIATLSDATAVLTDSGGVQEEAPALDVPVLIARMRTERPEAVEAGCARLVGTVPREVKASIVSIFGDGELRARMARASNPFGDGRAAMRIAATLTGAWSEVTIVDPAAEQVATSKVAVSVPA